MLERLRRGVIGVIGGVIGGLGLVNGRCPVCAALTAPDTDTGAACAAPAPPP
jgi:hypothetical protein